MTAPSAGVPAGRDASERGGFSALLAKIGCLALVVLPIISDDTSRQFRTPTNDLGRFLYENWWKLLNSSGPEALGWAKFNTVELLIAATAVAAAWSLRAARRWPVVTAEMLLAIFFIAAVAAMLVFGLATGGAAEPALWQVRPYFHMVALVLLLPQVVRTTTDLGFVLGAMIAAILVKSLVVIAIFVVQAHARFSGWRELVGHEDSVFFVAALCFLFALLLYWPGMWRKAWLFVAGPLLFAALILNLRRAGYAALGLNAVLLPIILDTRRRAALLLIAGFAAAGAIYLALFWNAGGALGVPAEKLRSIFAGGAESDYSSNLYRSAENLNLWHTMRDHPLGVGFGKPFDKFFPIADISEILPNWDYHPHNAIFGLWMSLGSLGLVVFLFFFAGLLFSASYSIRRTTDPFVKSAAVFCVAALTSGLLVSNLDQFIWAQRGALFLGAVAGLVAAIGAIQGRTIAFRRHASADRESVPE